MHYQYILFSGMHPLPSAKAEVKNLLHAGRLVVFEGNRLYPSGKLGTRVRILFTQIEDFVVGSVMVVQEGCDILEVVPDERIQAF